MVESEKLKTKKPKKKRSTVKLPKDFGIGPKRKARAQVAALCYRGTAKGTEVLLITSRESRRWILPKGWTMPGLSPAEAAAQEAWEEAGVKGKLPKGCAGLYRYDKVLETGTDLPVTVAVFPIEVKKLEEDFPEKGQRKRKWFSLKKASTRVQEPELKKLLRKFKVKKLG